MVEKKNLNVEDFLSAFDYQIGNLIFGKYSEIFMCLQKYPNELIKWNECELLNNQLAHCYYVLHGQLFSCCINIFNYKLP